jgi:hypothetical protein
MKEISDFIPDQLKEGKFNKIVASYCAEVGMSIEGTADSTQATALGKIIGEVLYQLFTSADAVSEQYGYDFLDYLIDHGWFQVLQNAVTWWHSGFFHPLLCRSIGTAQYIEKEKKARLLRKLLISFPSSQIVCYASEQIALLAQSNAEAYELLTDTLRHCPNASVDRALSLWLGHPDTSSIQIASLAFEAEDLDLRKTLLHLLKNNRKLSLLADQVTVRGTDRAVIIAIVPGLAGIGKIPSEVDDLLKIDLTSVIDGEVARRILLSGPFCQMESWVDYLMTIDCRTLWSAIAENFWHVRQGLGSERSNKADTIRTELLSRRLPVRGYNALTNSSLAFKCQRCGFYETSTGFCSVEPTVATQGTFEEIESCGSFELK